MKVYSLVEGHGEVQAFPILLRRLFVEAGISQIGVGQPIRRTQSQLRSKDGIQAGVKLALLQPECAEPPTNSEQKRDAKSVLEQYMPPRRAYSETGDQPGMSAVFGLGLAYRRNRSFRKLVKTIGDLLRELRQPVPLHWPPQEWDVAS